MFSFLPIPIRFVFSFLLFVFNTVGASLFILLLTPFKRLGAGALLVWAAESWIWVNGFNLRLFHRVKMELRQPEGLSREKSYLVIANHRSWVDILILQETFNRKIPFLRFFLKQQLIWVPFLGGAWWALDFPFMRRYTKEQLARHPDWRGRDLETTRLACERFRGRPISILNFLEGTRFTPHKHAAQKSPYRHLLNPKSGGVAFVLQAMGAQFDSLLDVTIHYPDGAVAMMDVFAGRLERVEVTVKQRVIPSAVLSGRNYQEDEAFRTEFQQWISDLWSEKDSDLEAVAKPRS